ncbi:hypothetical protein [Streptomyces antibioticus]|uniref:hypothetical protein n=1 Tax=Streptomyces antibioticus TaxID=1890 RepID=UPI00225245B2|nr:hypothetical protein [Streptomyces antibioticus]MCX4743781.1 hypothetical protein [Streptomyces antibioticus]
MDWLYDEALTAQIRRMSRARRYQATFLALRRLHAPLVDMEIPEEWGVGRVVVNSLLNCGAARVDGEANDALQQVISELSRAPLFASEIDPNLAESFQLEAIGGWILLTEALGEMSEVQTDRIIILAREQAHYLDQCIEETVVAVEGEELRESYLENVEDRLRAYGLGYFATRNLEVEGRCHDVITGASTGENVLNSAAGRALLDSCDRYSREIVSALRVFACE